MLKGRGTSSNSTERLTREQKKQKKKLIQSKEKTFWATSKVRTPF